MELKRNETYFISIPVFPLQIESLEEKHLPARSLKIMAEAFAIKGLCYEKLPLQV